MKMKLVNEQKVKELKFKAEAGDGGAYVRPGGLSVSLTAAVSTCTDSRSHDRQQGVK